MKKQIPKPENWQDFESLCKKLWGEIWEIPYKIKKNGRIGQPQNGVDIYGIPKGASKYWGIQCKGKDEYTHAKLTKKEIEEEIIKANNFSPRLEVFIIATTSNKDAEIEEFVRELDIDSRKNDGFEILLFCWEDIVDLIEENKNTYQYYVNNSQFRYKYDFAIVFDEGQIEKILNPKFQRVVKKYVLKKGDDRDLIYQLQSIRMNGLLGKYSFLHNSLFDNPNTAICKFYVFMKNIGSVVIENWHVTFKITGEHKPINELRFPNGMPNFSFDTRDREIVEESKIKYYSENLLIQDDEVAYPIEIIPLPKEYQVQLNWELKARDFNKRGELILNVVPIFEDEVEYILVEDESNLKEMEIISIRENKYKIKKDNDIDL